MPVQIIKAGWKFIVNDDEYKTGIYDGSIDKPDFVFLFDTTGYAAEPFTKAGFTTLIVDIENVDQYKMNDRASQVANWDILAEEDFIAELCKTAKFVFGFPPCTDLAVSGNRHFAAKRAANPNFQHDAVYLARSVERIGRKANIPWSAENPISVMSTLWRKPNYTFNPYEFGGYLPEDDVHPEYPQYIAARDRYPKTTNLWQGNGFRNPPRKVLWCPPGYSDQYNKLGGKSKKTKRIRSASPRGYFVALAEIYAK